MCGSVFVELKTDAPEINPTPPSPKSETKAPTLAGCQGINTVKPSCRFTEEDT